MCTRAKAHAAGLRAIHGEVVRLRIERRVAVGAGQQQQDALPGCDAVVQQSK